MDGSSLSFVFNEALIENQVGIVFSCIGYLQTGSTFAASALLPSPFRVDLRLLLQ